MRQYLTILAAAALFLLPVFSAHAAQTRTALVIGNRSYHSASLANPKNDALDMAAALKKFGFDVLVKVDADKRSMITLVGRFHNKLKKSDVGLFYYAGHGMQISGRNWLLPVNIHVTSEADVKFEAVDAGRILGKMKDAGSSFNIVLLDACRDNPFKRSFRTAQKGLARMDAPRGTIIRYATSPGSLAAEGTGRNGVCTKHLIRNIKKAQITVEQVFKNVRVAVVSETANQQVPWEASSLMGTFYFDPHQTGGGHIRQAIMENPSSVNSNDALFWESVKDSKDAKMYEAYLEQFPNGTFAKLAEIYFRKYSTHTPQTQKPVILQTKTQKSSTQLAAISPTDKDPAIQVEKGGQIKYSNGIVYDTRTGLEWVACHDEHTGEYAAESWVKNLTWTEVAGGCRHLQSLNNYTKPAACYWTPQIWLCGCPLLLGASASFTATATTTADTTLAAGRLQPVPVDDWVI